MWLKITSLKYFDMSTVKMNNPNPDKVVIGVAVDAFGSECPSGIDTVPWGSRTGSVAGEGFEPTTCGL